MDLVVSIVCGEGNSLVVGSVSNVEPYWQYTKALPMFIIAFLLSTNYFPPLIGKYSLHTFLHGIGAITCFQVFGFSFLLTNSCTKICIFFLLMASSSAAQNRL